MIRPSRFLLTTALAAASAAFSIAAEAADNSAAAAGAASAPSYAAERAACRDGDMNRSRENCLREAAAAREERQRGRLPAKPPADVLESNALQRCFAVHRADHEGPVARSDGGGDVVGPALEARRGSMPAQRAF